MEEDSSYTKIWWLVLRKLLAWDDETAAKWIEEQYAIGARHAEWFYHEGPMYYLARPIMHSFAVLSKNSEINAFGEVLLILERFEAQADFSDANWMSLRSQIVDVLSKYRASSD